LCGHREVGTNLCFEILVTATPQNPVNQSHAAPFRRRAQTACSLAMAVVSLHPWM
jgi:hypothetical protein